MKNFSMYVGLDVHKNSIEIALANSGREGEVRRYGSTGGDMESFGKAVRKLVSTGADLNFAYEAGPCGYHVFRFLRSKGLKCVVVAPSRIPKKAGDHIKTDARDAESLARLYRAGELTEIWVPSVADEAMRDLSRAREDAKLVESQARHRLKGFLLRHGVPYPGKTSWGLAHRRWLSTVKMGHPAQQLVLEEYMRAVEEASLRVERFVEQIQELLPSWSQAPLVRSLQALRGVSLVAASTLVAELGDINRFETATGLMSYVGLVPGQDSSGQRVRMLSITKAGNPHARRMLVESSWAYRHPARISRPLLERQEELPKKVRDIAWKAQVRLCAKFRKMTAKGRKPQIIVVAVARELLGFAWAIARENKIKTSS
jgi:transposase